MAVNFRDATVMRSFENGAQSFMVAGLARSAGSIYSSTEVDGIEIRMLQPYIRNNKTLKLWPFSRKAKLYCLTMVISDIANQLVGMMDLNTFAEVGANEYLPINKTIFYWQGTNTDHVSPNQVHVMSSIIKSKERLREVGTIFSKVKEDMGYKSLIGELSSIVADAATFSTVTNIAMQLASIVGRYMGKVDDNPIGTVVNSFTRLHGDWDKVGVTPIHLYTKNVDFHFELIVRDSKREMHIDERAMFNSQVQGYSMTPMQD